MERKDWNRIGLAAAVLLVPGGFLLGAALAARRYARKDETTADATATGPSTPERDAKNPGRPVGDRGFP